MSSATRYRSNNHDGRPSAKKLKIRPITNPAGNRKTVSNAAFLYRLLKAALSQNIPNPKYRHIIALSI